MEQCKPINEPTLAIRGVESAENAPPKERTGKDKSLTGAMETFALARENIYG